MKIAFIPLRCGSKSIPLKNIKPFCGKPLVFWNLQALEYSTIDKIVVATDCNKIENIIKSFQFSKVEIYRRDAENAQDSSSTESVMLEYLTKNNFQQKDIFMLVQATSPLTETKDFNQALEKFKNTSCDSLLSCVRTKRFFWDLESQAINYNFSNRPRRQDFEGLFMENGAFYISRIADILHSKNRISGKIAIYEMEEYKGIEIDEPVDWEIAQMLMQNYQSDRFKPKKHKIKLFVSDVDGTLTDGGMYYFDNGIEGKKFNTTDGKGFEILRKYEIKTGILTGENNKIITKRANKLKIDYIYMGLNAKQKLKRLESVCKKEKINLCNVAYVGDDINCIPVLEKVGIKACPSNAHYKVKNLKGIIRLSKSGGEGAVREFIDLILQGDKQ
ncbi:acylneuraminate cytidylyltransferase [Helicobacter sp.]|uniref:acylneuraminate cytidylyltransferase n=1 Tax=Helicobacter sp. TaxID=218 RepID=UPI00199C348D|nr:acylneuraminate cytidylyltransferase [Helicobacter sp.]MBD5164950.1 acylneuraminate cytidylyltransferase [Helicobacter sp.]